MFSSCQLVVVSCQAIDGAFNQNFPLPEVSTAGKQLLVVSRQPRAEQCSAQYLTTDNQQFIIKLDNVVAVNQERHAFADTRLAEDELGHAGRAHSGPRVQLHVMLLMEAELLWGESVGVHEMIVKRTFSLKSCGVSRTNRA